MRNLEQIRAANALEPAKNLSRSAVSKLPAMILGNGLLATAAFCNADGGGDNRVDMKKALNATAAHLSKQGQLAPNSNTVTAMIADLSQRDSHHLQRATAEALAYLAYLKRFATKEGDNG